MRATSSRAAAASSGWSFTKVRERTCSAQEVVKEKSDDEKKKEALSKAGEAALATPQGQALKEKVLNDPVVKTVKEAVTSTPGMIVTGAAAAGGVARARGDGEGAAVPAAGDPARQDHARPLGAGHVPGAGERADLRRADADVQGAGAEGRQGEAGRSAGDARPRPPQRSSARSATRPGARRRRSSA